MSGSTKKLRRQARASADTLRDRAASGYAEASKRADAAAKALAGKQPVKKPLAAAVAGGVLVGALASMLVRGLARYLKPATRKEDELLAVPADPRTEELVHH